VDLGENQGLLLSVAGVRWDQDLDISSAKYVQLNLDFAKSWREESWSRHALGKVSKVIQLET